MDPFTIASGALGLLSGIAGGTFGAIKSSEQAALANSKQQERDTFNSAMFARQYYQDALSRSDTQNMLRKLRNNMREATQAQANTAVVTGQTPEAIAATKNANAQAYADAIAEIAAHDSTRKDNALAQYGATQNQSFTDWINNLRTQSANWTNFATQSFGSGISSIDTLASGLDKQ